MHSFCKGIDITDLGFIKISVLNCLKNKWTKDKTLRFLSRYDENLSRKEIQEIQLMYGNEELDFLVERIAKEIQYHIINRNIVVPEIRYKKKYDYNSGKTREIGVEDMIQQCYEHVAVDACMEMFNKKIGKYQCASIPNRGQIYGKNAIYRWLRTDIKGTRYFVKLDIQKCYPSIKQSIMKMRLHRDIKNPDLLYLLDTMIDTFTKGGLSIGSHLSQWLCNYFLSYAYHYAEQELFIIKNGKRKRLISHMLFYMDDIILFSGNKKHLVLAVEKLISYFETDLGLRVKPKWNINKVKYTDKKGKTHGVFVDMMGFKIYREGVAIRKSISIKIARKAKRVRKKIKNHQPILIKDSFQICSYNGWVVNSNSKKFHNKNELGLCLSKSGRVMSSYSKNQYYKQFNKKYELIYGKGGYYGSKLQSLRSD